MNNEPGVVHHFIEEVNMDPTRYDQVEWHMYRCTCVLIRQSTTTHCIKWLICNCQITSNICVSIVYKLVWIVIVATRYHIRITTRHHCTFWSVNCIMVLSDHPDMCTLAWGPHNWYVPCRIIACCTWGHPSQHKANHWVYCIGSSGIFPVWVTLSS